MGERGKCGISRGERRQGNEVKEEREDRKMLKKI